LTIATSESRPAFTSNSNDGFLCHGKMPASVRGELISQTAGAMNAE
jgi:hypothetical protein